MATAYSKLMQSAKVEAGHLALEIPEDWKQGRSVFGGLQVALALKAMRALVPDIALRTLQATFVAPVAGGLVRAQAQVLRSGKSATHVEARIIDGAETATLVVGVFGTARSSTVAVTPVQPRLEAAQAIDLQFIPGLVPSFVQHFTARWLQGLPPFTGDTAREHVVEVGFLDDGPTTEGHVVGIADFIPPLAFSHLKVPVPGSTLTWMLELLADRVDHLPLVGWRVDAELVAARDGYTSQSVMVWGPGGEPVAISRQSMLVFG
jgi:acyl-coenzyme A thioesterase PaaI-like protein